jgi:hypothetical protein
LWAWRLPLWPQLPSRPYPPSRRLSPPSRPGSRLIEHIVPSSGLRFPMGPTETPGSSGCGFTTMGPELRMKFGGPLGPWRKRGRASLSRTAKRRRSRHRWLSVRYGRERAFPQSTAAGWRRRCTYPRTMSVGFWSDGVTPEGLGGRCPIRDLPLRAAGHASFRHGNGSCGDPSQIGSQSESRCMVRSG